MALPPLHKQARNAVGALGRVLKALSTGDQVLATPPVRSTRLMKCQTCPLSKPDDLPVEHRRCEHCGCYIEPKVALQTETCPEGHW